MNLKQLRKSKHLTQIEAAELCGLSRKGYQNLESGAYKKKNSPTLRYAIARLEEAGRVDESHGILSRKRIEEVSLPFFARLGASFLILLGDYAKEPKEDSSLQFLADVSLSELDLLAAEESLQEELRKEVNIIPFASADEEVLKEALSTGIRLLPKEK